MSAIHAGEPVVLVDRRSPASRSPGRYAREAVTLRDVRGARRATSSHRCATISFRYCTAPLRLRGLPLSRTWRPGRRPNAAVARACAHPSRTAASAPPGPASTRAHIARHSPRRRSRRGRRCARLRAAAAAAGRARRRRPARQLRRRRAAAAVARARLGLELGRFLAAAAARPGGLVVGAVSARLRQPTPAHLLERSQPRGGADRAVDGR